MRCEVCCSVLTIFGHTRPPGNTSDYDDNICASECFLETIICGKIASHLCSGVDVVQIRGNAEDVNEVV